MRKNSFFTFCFAFIPGFGQMYQGYMRRGLSLLTWFAGVAMLAFALEIGPILILLPVIWAYSFFDTFNIQALSDEQHRQFADDFIPSAGWLQSNALTSLLSGKQRRNIGGWLLIGAGGVMLYQLFINNVYWPLQEYFPTLARLIRAIPSLVIAFAVIWLGARMLQNGKKLPPAEEEPIEPFKGGNDDE